MNALRVSRMEVSFEQAEKKRGRKALRKRLRRSIATRIVYSMQGGRGLGSFVLLFQFIEKRIQREKRGGRGKGRVMHRILIRRVWMVNAIVWINLRIRRLSRAEPTSRECADSCRIRWTDVRIIRENVQFRMGAIVEIETEYPTVSPNGEMSNFDAKW